MLISVGAGYILTTDGRIVPGGPQMISLGSGCRLTPDGKIAYDGPVWDTGTAAPVSSPMLTWQS